VKIVSKQLVITEGAEEMWRNWQSFHATINILHSFLILKYGMVSDGKN
jgi:hypothetical protein